MGLYPKLKSGKGKIKGDLTPGVKPGKGGRLSTKMNYAKMTPVKTRSVKVKRRV